MTRCCNQDCNQGRTCPNRQKTSLAPLVNVLGLLVLVPLHMLADWLAMGKK